MKLSELKGIGEKTEKLFTRMGIYSAEDLLCNYPRTYDVYEEPVRVCELEYDNVMAVAGRLAKAPVIKRIRNLLIINAVIKDEDGNALNAVWYNALYVKQILEENDELIFRGLIKRKGAGFVINQPQIFTKEKYAANMGAMQPVYPLTSGLSNNAVIKAVKQAVDIRDIYPKCVPDSIAAKYGFCNLEDAVMNIHFPKNRDEMLVARRRLVFDEFFSFVYTMKRFNDRNTEIRNKYIIRPDDKVERMIQALPYNLTGAQQRAWNDIKSDFTNEKICNRLIQGDVGSGKTIIAILAAFSAASCGYQAAIMAPTEVLARQHFDEVKRLIAEYEFPFEAVFLAGSTKAKEKKKIYEDVYSNESVRIIIGTHAIFQEKVKYRNLALVVTDEQHRFGVKQREAINNKGDNPHVLVMSATPIPRTLAIIMYGDLSVSIIDEMPKGRLPIKNALVNADYRENAYRFIANQVKLGYQAYVICPIVENSEMSEGENVIEYAKMLKDKIPGVNIQYLHGRMKADEKNNIMQDFADNKIQVLVSTTVIEVGVNVPNSTVMMIENAEKFGLATLHQLRGRVGRGNSQSYCIFVNGSGKSQADERLSILTKSNDGFFVSREDLKLRGPGDFFGVRQSGDMEFRLGDIYDDSDIVQTAAKAAEHVIDNADELSDEEVNLLDSLLKSEGEIVL